MREFKSFTKDLERPADWLKDCGVDTVAMESTAVYWIPLFELLDGRGFTVLLVNARHLKNVSGRKSDVLDCQWLQQLMTPGTRAAVAAAPLDPLRLQTQLLRAHANVAEEDGWALIARVAQYGRANQSDFDPRHHGASSFSRLLEATAVFDVVVRNKGNGQTHFCRPKNSLTQPIATHHLDRAVAADYVQALGEAVSRSQGPDGWSSAVAIGQQLKAMGRELKESGCATRHEALAAAGLFEIVSTGCKLTQVTD